MKKVGVFILLYLMVSHVAMTTEMIRPKVPSTMQFADMQLKFTDGARREIQKEVDALTKSPTYYNIKADRIKLYFPIIEKTLVESGVPGDFKYLAVQESALISDAVSSSKAVGFWQFKDFTGREVGLRIDKRVDERLNVVSSTIGAAKYFKRNNFYFNNWIYAILAHMTGRGGAEKYIDKRNFGAKKMTLDHHTHWYVRRFLAHMIAFKEVDKGPHSEGMILDVHTKGGGQTIKELAKKTKSDELELKKYNKWLKSGAVPMDKPYAILIPKKGTKSNYKGISIPTPMVDNNKKGTSTHYPFLIDNPEVTGTIFIKINGIPCILAGAGDTMEKLAQKAQLHIERFAKYNDLATDANIKEGEIYYLKRKRNRARSYFHTAQSNETLWDVSQKFGIKLNKLARLNRMSIIDVPRPGRVLWLHNRRPEDVPIEIKDLPMMPVDEAIPLREMVKENKKEERLKIDTVKVEKYHDEVLVGKDIASDVRVYVVKHTVQKGESLYAIASQFDVTVSDLTEWNELEDYILDIGQVLTIHSKRKDASDHEVPREETSLSREKIGIHVVEPGDTMYGISQKYNVSIEDLLHLNQKDNFDLTIGERLILRK